MLQLLEDPSGDPFIPTGAQGGGRAGRISDLGMRTDNLSEVLTVAGFVQDEESNGIYFFDGSGATLEVPVGANAESAPNGGTPGVPRKSAGIPEPIADDDQRWILSNDPINVPQNAGPPPLLGTEFTNYATATAVSLPPQRCATGGTEEPTEGCQITHYIRAVASFPLPLTGGPTPLVFIALGSVLLVFAAVGTLRRRDRRQ